MVLDLISKSPQCPKLLKGQSDIKQALQDCKAHNSKLGAEFEPEPYITPQNIIIGEQLHNKVHQFLRDLLYDALKTGIISYSTKCGQEDQW